MSATKAQAMRLTVVSLAAMVAAARSGVYAQSGTAGQAPRSEPAQSTAFPDYPKIDLEGAKVRQARRRRSRVTLLALSGAGRDSDSRFDGRSRAGWYSPRALPDRGGAGATPVRSQ